MLQEKTKAILEAMRTERIASLAREARMTELKKELRDLGTRSDILPPEDYGSKRTQLLEELSALDRARRAAFSLHLLSDGYDWMIEEAEVRKSLQGMDDIYALKQIAILDKVIAEERKEIEALPDLTPETKEILLYRLSCARRDLGIDLRLREIRRPGKTP